MYKLQFFFFVTLFFSFTSYTAEKTFLIEESRDSGWFISDSRLDCSVDGCVVGYAGLSHLPFSCHVIHSLYVYPEFRGRGYGRTLLVHACELLKQRNAWKVFIQPGPFELSNGKIIDPESYDQELLLLNQLSVFYAHVGFRKVNWLYAKAAKLLYWLISLDENADFLMVK